MACFKGMAAGSLRHKINIERAVKVSDGMGGNFVSWKAITDNPIKAKVLPLSGTEALKSMRLEANISHRITIRFRAGLLPSDRINYNGRIMQIRSKIDLEERHRWLELMCEEGAAT